MFFNRLDNVKLVSKEDDLNDGEATGSEDREPCDRCGSYEHLTCLRMS